MEHASTLLVVHQPFGKLHRVDIAVVTTGYADVHLSLSAIAMINSRFQRVNWSLRQSQGQSIGLKERKQRELTRPENLANCIAERRWRATEFLTSDGALKVSCLVACSPFLHFANPCKMYG